MSFTRDMKIRHLEDLEYEAGKAAFFKEIEGKTPEELNQMKESLITEKKEKEAQAAVILEG